MVFSSPTFLFIFLPVVFALSILLRKRIPLCNALLTVASLLFYAWGEPVYVLLMILTTLVSYLAAAGIAKYEKRRKLFLVIGVVWGIASLVFFKYTDFLLGSINGLVGAKIPLPGIALPIGISFFTFQAVSYIIDVYRKDAQPAKNYFHVLLYISLFPQLIAGPIVRYSDIAKELKERTVTVPGVAAGFRRFAFGMGKKVLISNTLAITADAVFGKADLTAPMAWLGAVAYMLQIYFDFSGYSDMAIGLGRAFGFTFKENFEYPYSSSSMQEFWRRWHISLSTWFREYVYIPLGGNRRGRLRTGINKMLVFLLTGLWHGASWNFVLWGLWHGAFLMLESYGVLKPKEWPKAIAKLYTLFAVMLGFVLFRAETLAEAWHVISSMFVGWNFDPASMAEFSHLISPLTAATMVLAGIASSKKLHLNLRRLEGKFAVCERLAYAAAFCLILLSALCIATSSYNPFIYFRF